MIHSNVLALVGQTPLVELGRFSPAPGVQILAKLESFNPGGSIKDRVALAMIEAAEASGELTPDKTVIEATSGNTGIGLAMVCAIKGYRLKLLMPESASEERKAIMRAYGADIGLTPGRLGTDGAIEEAYRLARENPGAYFLADQFNNPASIAAHYHGTAAEIIAQAGEALTHVVASLGTSGTAMGVASRIKDHCRETGCSVEVAAVEPRPGHRLQGLKNMQESYPPGIFDRRRLDRTLRVDDEEAFALCRELARREGLLVGMSSGAALAGALQLAREAVAEGKPARIVCIFPDGGERYLSTTLFSPLAGPGARGPRFLDAFGRETAFASDSVRCHVLGPSLDRPLEASAWRRIVWADALARALGRLKPTPGSPAPLDIGLADFDDRTLAAAREAGVIRDDYARQASEAVSVVAARLVGRAPDRTFGLVLASERREAAREAVRTLMGRGLAYEKLRSVYFDVARDKAYGQARQTGALRAGATVDMSGYVKEHPSDFTLLKRAALMDLKRGEFWAEDWGSVRPSWFLQRAACIPACEGSQNPVAVVGDGEHVSPHLDNLRAILGYGIKGFGDGKGGFPGAFLAVEPVVTPGEHERPLLPQLADSDPLTVRAWLLSTSRRKPLVLTDDALAMWAANRARLTRLVDALANAQADAPANALADKATGGAGGEVREDIADSLGALKARFMDCLTGDFAFHALWPALFTTAKKLTALMDSLTPAEARSALDTLEEIDSVLGVMEVARRRTGQAGPALAGEETPEAVRALAAAREAARAAKDWAEADRLRAEIAALGFQVQDGPAGQRLIRI